MKQYLLILMMLAATHLVAQETLVYFSIKGEKSIKCYKLDTVNKRLIEQSTTLATGKPGALCTSSTNKYLFASLRSTKEASSFIINQKDGSLTPINTIDISDDACHISVSANDKYLLAAYYSASKVAIYPIDTNGVLNANKTDEHTVSKYAHTIRQNPQGNLVYVPTLGADQVNQYAFNQETGKLVALDPENISSPANTGPRHLTYHPKLDVVYFSMELSSQTMACKHSESGLEAPFQIIENLPVDYASEKWTSDLHITPNGKYLYAANRVRDTDDDAGTITGFSVDSISGELTLIDRFETEKVVRAFDIDPSGKFLIAGGESSGNVVLYQIQADGQLGELQKFSAGTDVSWVMCVNIGEEQQEPNGIKQSDAIDLKIYPNPSQGQFTIETNETNASSVKIQVVDALGRIIINNLLPKNSGSIQIDLSKSPTGIYNVTLHSNGRNGVSKVFLCQN